MPEMSEHHEQAALIAWAKSMEGTFPTLALLHSIPNGGWRHKATAVYLRTEGLKSGVPDLDLPVPIGEYHGLRIEMKYGKNKPTDNQRWWLEKLAEQGYAIAVCWTCEEAQTCILEYLEGRHTQSLHGLKGVCDDNR